MAVRCASGSKILASRPLTADLVQRWLSLHYSAIKRIIYNLITLRQRAAAFRAGEQQREHTAHTALQVFAAALSLRLHNPKAKR